MDDPARPRSSWKLWAFVGGCGLLLAIVTTIASAIALDEVRSLFVSERTRAKMDISVISSAVEVFAIDNSGRQPTRLMELVTPDPTGRTYLKDRRSVPLDPWHNPYDYEPPTAPRAYRVFSLGSDGVPGGVGDAADIDNWSLAASQGR